MKIGLGIVIAIVALAAFGTQTSYAAGAGTVKDCTKAEMKVGKSTVKVLVCNVHPGSTGTVVVHESGTPYQGTLALCDSPAPGATNCATLLGLNGSSCQQFNVSLSSGASDPTFASLSLLGIPPFDATGNLNPPLPSPTLKALSC